MTAFALLLAVAAAAYGLARLLRLPSVPVPPDYGCPARSPRRWCKPQNGQKHRSYPINHPVDTDNDLIVINDSLTSTWASLLATCERMKPLLEPKSFPGNCFE